MALGEMLEGEAQRVEHHQLIAAVELAHQIPGEDAAVVDHRIHPLHVALDPVVSNVGQNPGRRVLLGGLLSHGQVPGSGCGAEGGAGVVVCAGCHHPSTDGASPRPARRVARSVWRYPP